MGTLDEKLNDLKAVINGLSEIADNAVNECQKKDITIHGLETLKAQYEKNLEEEKLKNSKLIENLADYQKKDSEVISALTRLQNTEDEYTRKVKLFESDKRAFVEQKAHYTAEIERLNNTLNEKNSVLFAITKKLKETEQQRDLYKNKASGVQPLLDSANAELEFKT